MREAVSCRYTTIPLPHACLGSKLHAKSTRPKAIPAPKTPVGWWSMAWLDFEVVVEVEVAVVVGVVVVVVGLCVLVVVGVVTVVVGEVVVVTEGTVAVVVVEVSVVVSVEVSESGEIHLDIFVRHGGNHSPVDVDAVAPVFHGCSDAT